MSYHSNNKQEKCWSCEFFCGERKHKEGLFLGDSTETSPNGMCSCKIGRNYNEMVSESNWCSKYQRWRVLAAYIAKKESEEQLKKYKEENARIEREMHYEQERNKQEESYNSLPPKRKKAIAPIIVGITVVIVFVSIILAITKPISKYKKIVYRKIC